jgi:hypothetical protein
MASWVEHERAIAGLEPIPVGTATTGVTGEFRASHDDPKGRLPRHWHTWEVTAWFPEGTDGRDWLYELDQVLGRLDGKHLEPEYAWNEAIARLVGTTMLDCVEVEVRRDRERIHGRWRA